MRGSGFAPFQRDPEPKKWGKIWYLATDSTSQGLPAAPEEILPEQLDIVLPKRSAVFQQLCQLYYFPSLAFPNVLLSFLLKPGQWRICCCAVMFPPDTTEIPSLLSSSWLREQG